MQLIASMQRMFGQRRPYVMRLAVVVSAFLVLAALGGCGRGAGQRQTPSGEELPEQREFLSTRVFEGGEPKDLAAGSRIRLAFAGGELRADAGCNHLGGTARLEEGRLVVEGMGGTEMGCPDELMKQDQWLTDFLTSRPRWNLDGDNLTLAGKDAEIRLTDRRVADPDRPLRGTRWMLDTIIDGDIASSVPDGVKTPVLMLTRNRAFGFNGCNGIARGKVQVSGSRLRLSDFVFNLNLCTRDNENTVAEAVMSVLLDKRLEYKIEAARLTLTTPSGKGLGFSAAG